MELTTDKLSIVRFSQQIKEKAFELGCDKVGIVPADALTDEREKLEEWLRRGFHAEMRWMERETERRTAPRFLLPSARSVVVVAVNYFTPHKHEDSDSTGKVSRYAWGDDYHDVVGEKLKALLAFIKEEMPQAEGKACVDIQPMMDKAWAVRAGFGWIGKHTNLITQDYGSWVFIGELILNLELDYDNEKTDEHCGTCTLCIDACPTNAIVEPFVVDSNKCLSHATIELRTESLPEEIQENIDGWLYGCDVCQDVCPWNRFEQTTSEKRFEPRVGNVNADLAELMNLTHEEYVARFRKSAMKRAKLSGLKRNAETLLNQNSKLKIR